MAVEEATVDVPLPTMAPAAPEPQLVPAVKPADLARRVEVVSGQHLVANVNGTVIVVANRGSAWQQSAASQQMTHLVEIVRQTDPAMLAYAFSQLIKSGTWSRHLVEVGIVMPTANGLEIFVCGAVTVALDDGNGVTLIEGRNRCVHLSVSAPAVAAVVTVDELGKLPAVAPPNRGGVFTLPEGIVPGRGAVVWSTDAESAPRRAPEAPSPAMPAPAPIDRLAIEPTVQIARPNSPKRWVVLDDDTRFEIDGPCVIGRDPQNASAANKGLRPIRIDDESGLMSRAHLEVRQVDGELVVVDRNSTNGVMLRDQGQHEWTRLAPWQPAVWRMGASIRVGGRTLQLLPAGAHRPPRQPHARVPHVAGV